MRISLQKFLSRSQPAGRGQIPAALWPRLFLRTLLAAGAYVFFEWLFIVTKPSFMSPLGMIQKAQILLFASLLVSASAIATLVPLALIGPHPFARKGMRALVAVGAMTPALLLACLTLLLLDNFTYTVFRFGVVNARGVGRLIYACLFLAMAAFWWFNTQQYVLEPRQKDNTSPASKLFYPGLLLVALIPGIIIAYHLDTTRRSLATSATADRRPNILLITADGLNAENLSLYGYARDTTPNLVRLAKKSLVAENAFSNSGSTAGSLISLYTGKSPARVRVLYAPDILQGQDAYQHLPGLLRAQGYVSEQFSLPHYADPYTFNLLEGFDRANGREANTLGNLTNFDRFLPPDHAYFAAELFQRITQRLAHIFFLATMEDPYAQVTQPARTYDEQNKFTSALRLLKTSSKPTFLHIHYLGTHGPRFAPARQRFSSGQNPETQSDWNVDFYDDAILEFDRVIGETVKTLTARGQLENTILIIGSDHGETWNPLRRIPLLMRFPNGEFKGKITANVQNMDIAPTILDYLGLDIPGWMEGESLLGGTVAPRPIFAVTMIRALSSNDENFLEINREHVRPPFYQFGALSLIDCQQWHRINLEKLTWDVGTIPQHTAPCSPDRLLTDAQALQKMVDYLQANGFDASSLLPLLTTQH